MGRRRGDVRLTTCRLGIPGAAVTPRERVGQGSTTGRLPLGREAVMGRRRGDVRSTTCRLGIPGGALAPREHAGEGSPAGRLPLGRGPVRDPRRGACPSEMRWGWAKREVRTARPRGSVPRAHPSSPCPISRLGTLPRGKAPPCCRQGRQRRDAPMRTCGASELWPRSVGSACASCGAQELSL